MDRANEKSLTELKRDAEHTRTQLTETVDQLRLRMSDTVTEFRARTSPAAMKAEVGDYFRTKADALIDRARENPLQTAAIGIGIGYPVLKIARSIPAPILMVGAGLYLLGTGSGQKLSDAVSKKVSEAAGRASDSLSDGLDDVNNKVHDVRESVASTLEAAQDSVASAVGTVTQKAASFGSSFNELKDGAANVAGSAAHRSVEFKQRAVDALQAAPNAIGAGAGATRTGSILGDGVAYAAELGTRTAELGANAGAMLRDQAVEKSRKANSGMSDVFQRNPLLFGGLGLTVGMLLASALPRSNIEKDILGDASADVRKRANVLASQQFDNVKGVASEAIAGLADHANREGLMPADLNAATEDLGRRLRKVAESAGEAALGTPDTSHFRTHT